MLAVSVPSNGQAITGMGIGARVGFVFDYDHPQLEEQDIEPKDLSMYGAHVTLLAISKLSVELSGEYSYRDYKQEIGYDIGPDRFIAIIDLKVRDYAAFITGRYKLIQGNLGVHLGGGLNFHRFTYSMELPLDQPEEYFWDVIGVPEIPEKGWHSGFHVLAGVSLGLPALPFRAFGEARVAKINVSGDAAQQATIIAGVTFGMF